MDRFFSYCPNCGFEKHKTAKEAEEASEECIDICYRDHACDGWSDEVEEICWGEIKASAAETERRPYDPENDHGVETPCDWITDYGMRPIHEPGQSSMAV